MCRGLSCKGDISPDGCPPREQGGVAVLGLHPCLLPDLCHQQAQPRSNVPLSPCPPQGSAGPPGTQGPAGTKVWHWHQLASALASPRPAWQRRAVPCHVGGLAGGPHFGLFWDARRSILGWLPSWIQPALGNSPMAGAGTWS